MKAINTSYYTRFFEPATQNYTLLERAVYAVALIVLGVLTLGTYFFNPTWAERAWTIVKEGRLTPPPRTFGENESLPETSDDDEESLLLVPGENLPAVFYDTPFTEAFPFSDVPLHEAHEEISTPASPVCPRVPDSTPAPQNSSSSSGEPSPPVADSAPVSTGTPLLPPKSTRFKLKLPERQAQRNYTLLEQAVYAVALIVLGVLTLGIYFFKPTWAERAWTIVKEGRLAPPPRTFGENESLPETSDDDEEPLLLVPGENLPAVSYDTPFHEENSTPISPVCPRIPNSTPAPQNSSSLSGEPSPPVADSAPVSTGTPPLLPPKPTGFKLKLTEMQVKAITEIITTLATGNFSDLLTKRNHLETLGYQTKDCGLLHFFGYLLNNPVLEKHIRTIEGYSRGWQNTLNRPIWTNCVERFEPKFRTEIASTSFTEELRLFCLQFNRNYETLYVHVQKPNGKQFLSLLVNPEQK